MPMIEFRYDPGKLSWVQASEFAGVLEKALRGALGEMRASGLICNITVEGEPFVVSYKQPDLRVYVFYHADWNFEPHELAALPLMMARPLGEWLREANLTLDCKIRFYARTGHSSATVGG